MKILLAEDHQLVRKSWILMFQSYPNMEVVGDVSNGQEALDFLENHKVDILIMDIDMPILNGIETTDAIKKKWPWVKVVILSMFKEIGYLKKAMSAGACAYLTKNALQEEVKEMLDAIQKGGKYICNEMNVKLLEEKNNKQDVFDNLSKRELQIVELIGKGMSSKGISTHLEISMKTVESHRGNIYKKLRVKNVAELLNLARHRILTF